MKKKITVLTVCAMLLALCVTALAQQPGKMFRIGLLDASTASGSAVLVEAFLQELIRPRKHCDWNCKINLFCRF